ncbi:hypothetical protein Leryth_026566 [Lithospermum erythrorhizon]|nr:hypothetical protein Leryth_026566 [Lithospermum erythrorhizon]
MDPIGPQSNYFPKMPMMDNYVDHLDWLGIQDQSSVNGVWEEYHPPISQNYADYHSQLFDDQSDPYNALVPNDIIHHPEPSYFLQDFEDICGEYAMWEFNENANTPMCMALDVNVVDALDQAAKKLNVGLTVLKKRCRELNVMRWPHRKIKSLESLIDNVKGLGLCYEVEMLEEHKRLLEDVPELELNEETKKLRQVCFKANYKKRRSMLLQ